MNKTHISLAVAMLLMVLLGWGNSAQAQSAITFCGGNVANSNGSLSFSGGEVAVQYDQAPAITVVNITEGFFEGVQQPITPRDGQNTQGINPLEVSIAVYPNPAADHVVMAASEPTQQLGYVLYNANGQEVARGTFAGGEERIDLQHLATGSYMLHVANNDKTNMNIYKIIKAK